MTPNPTTAPLGPTDWAHVRWPAIVIALLAGHALLVTGALVLSSTLIPAASIAPSGYAEALRWDDLQAERAASARLGWTATVTPAPQADLMGRRPIEIVLLDAEGAPVEGAMLDVALYHYAKADQPVAFRAGPSDAAGRVVAAPPLRRAGQWRLTAVVQRGADRLLIETDVWAPEPGLAQPTAANTLPGGPIR
ncbi:FixH [Pirellulimonas nuda]|uniref:FixH n=1 Tax=Pirellulimonas nuda TaxID=2528009 RepID=A0A518DHS1_9BACT|nr:FixH family protein [Pirellulimonas nuda]QDU91028.1 FixH [Pirellulimonas nuda]